MEWTYQNQNKTPMRKDRLTAEQVLNSLCLFTRAGPVEYLDGVHFKEPGNELLGEAVAKVVRSSLPKSRKP